MLPSNFRDILDKSKILALDIETTGVDPLRDQIVLAAVATGSGEILVADNEVDVYYLCRELLEGHIIIAHNANFEYRFLYQIMNGRAPEKWFDTMLAERILTAGLNEMHATLADVVKRYAGITLDKGEQTAFVGKDIHDAYTMVTPAHRQYVANDVRYLHTVMRAQLLALDTADSLRVARLEMAFMPVLSEMMLTGFYLNPARHKEVLPAFIEAEERAREELATTLQTPYEEYIRRTNEARQARRLEIKDEIESLIPGGRVRKDTTPEVQERVAELRKERNRNRLLAHELINIGSHNQVWEALAVTGVELYKTEYDGTQKRSLDKFTIAEYVEDYPQLQVYADWAKASKVISTYGEVLRDHIHPITGRIHTSYNQMVDSGRLSSREPNQQNMPPAIRACFEAAEGNTLVVVDAKNQEGRIAAIMSRDPALLDVFHSGKDWHSMTAAAAWPHLYPTWEDVPKDSPERARAKNGNFSSIYGGGARTLLNRGYVDDLATGERIIEAIRAQFPRLVNWSYSIADAALERGYVSTISGRRRYFKSPNRQSLGYAEWKRLRGGIRRAAQNHPVQGSGADIMKLAMTLIHGASPIYQFRLVATVHDAVVYEGPPAYAEDFKEVVLYYMLEAGRCFTTLLDIPGEATITKVWK